MDSLAVIQLSAAPCGLSAGSVSDAVQAVRGHRYGVEADLAIGAFSRHTRLGEPGPGTGAEFPRHAGSFNVTWVKALKRIGNGTSLSAIATLPDSYAREATGAIPTEVGTLRPDDEVPWP